MTINEGEVVRTDTGDFRIVGLGPGENQYQAAPVRKVGAGYDLSGSGTRLISVRDIVEVVWPRYRRIRWRP